jgi:hypothetical protein
LGGRGPGERRTRRLTLGMLSCQAHGEFRRIVLKRALVRPLAISRQDALAGACPPGRNFLIWGKYRIREVSASKIRIRKNCAGEIRIAELRIGQVCPLEDSADELRTREVCPVRSASVSTVLVRFASVRIT